MKSRYLIILFVTILFLTACTPEQAHEESNHLVQTNSSNVQYKEPTCESDEDCILSEFSYCCMQDIRTAHYCFVKKNVPSATDCSHNDLCMRLREPRGCLCQDHQCVGNYERPTNTSIEISSQI